MSSTYSPAPSDCGSVELAFSDCDCLAGSQHMNGGCLKTNAVRYAHMDPIAPLTPQRSPIRRRPEEAILMDDLRRAREELRDLQNELQKVRDERDKWKNRNHGIPAECYGIIKKHGLQSELSLTTLQHLDTPAAITRLEAHDQHMRDAFARESCDLAATVQNTILEIQYVKTNMGGDTLRWRLYSALKLMQHISKGLQRASPRKSPHIRDASYSADVLRDEYLKSTLKSADIQLLSTLNEIRERGMDDYYQAFQEKFVPEYDLVHSDFALEFYEKTKVLMIHMYSQRRTMVAPQTRMDGVVSRAGNEQDEEEQIMWI